MTMRHKQFYETLLAGVHANLEAIALCKQIGAYNAYRQLIQDVKNVSILLESEGYYGPLF